MPDVPSEKDDDSRRWSVSEDASTGTFTLRMWGHMDARMVIDAIEELAVQLRRRVIPSVIVADLLDVEGFDVDAPVAAARVGAPIASLINHVEIIARRQVVRIASISAAHLLGLSCTARAER